MTAETKLRTLASGDATLQVYLLSAGDFRWFDQQMRQGAAFPNVTVLRVSTIRDYTMGGINPMSRIRFQIDVRDYSAETARAIAAAIIDFLRTADLASNAQFGCPATTPPQFPCFVLNQRGGMDYQLQPPPYVQTLDIRVFNLEA